jgi:hypothetical protein
MAEVFVIEAFDVAWRRVGLKVIVEPRKGEVHGK